MTKSASSFQRLNKSYHLKTVIAQYDHIVKNVLKLTGARVQDSAAAAAFFLFQ
jgi:hypothetical protein